MKIAKREMKAKIGDDSMADIAFLLIIFFMLTTTFSVNKGFDFGIPPTEQDSTSDSESRPALTIVVNGIGDSNRSYQVIVVDEQGQQQNFPQQRVAEVYDYVITTFNTVKIEQPDNWWKLPVYVLVMPEAPFEGFVDVWQQVQRVEAHLKPDIPIDEDSGEQKLATHIPHVEQVEEIITSYIEAGKIVL